MAPLQVSIIFKSSLKSAENSSFDAIFIFVFLNVDHSMNVYYWSVYREMSAL